MAIKIVIGGPKNSGKSTLVFSLKQGFSDIGIKVDWVELDCYSPTLSMLEGAITAEERAKLKRKDIPDEEVEQIAERLIGKEEFELLLGDLPGMISVQTRMLCEYATHAIILCNDQKLEEVGLWQNLFDEEKIPVVARIVSDLDGIEDIKVSNGVIEAVLAGLDRKVSESNGLVTLVFRLKELLDL